MQCYGPEASAFAKHLETGRTVTMAYDRELHDRYGRFLAYGGSPASGRCS